MIETEKKISSLEIGTRMLIPKSVLDVRKITGFWNSQNHPTSINEDWWHTSRPKGNLQSILVEIQSTTSKRSLGRILQRALITDLTTEERQQILEANKVRKGQL